MRGGGERRRRGPGRWPPIGPLAERERSGARAAGTGSVLKEPVGFDGPIEGSTGVYVEADNEVGVFLDGDADGSGAFERAVSDEGGVQRFRLRDAVDVFKVEFYTALADDAGTVVVGGEFEGRFEGVEDVEIGLTGAAKTEGGGVRADDGHPVRDRAYGVGHRMRLLKAAAVVRSRQVQGTLRASRVAVRTT